VAVSNTAAALIQSESLRRELQATSLKMKDPEEKFNGIGHNIFINLASNQFQKLEYS